MIQIHLEPEIEAELAAEAQARGLSPERYIEQLIAERSRERQAQTGSRDKLATLEKAIEEMADHSDKIPKLPDDAFTRESFYTEILGHPQAY